MSAKLIIILFTAAKITEYVIFMVLNILNIAQVKKSESLPKRFEGLFSAENFLKSRNYTLTKLNYGLFTETFDMLVLFLFIFSGGFRYLENLSCSLSSNETMRAVLFCFILSLGKEIIDLPFELYSTFVIEQKFGFNKMTPLLFFSDLIKKIILSFVLGIPVIWFLIYVIRSAGSLWWFYGFLGVTTFQLLIIFIYPTWIAPLFNKFKTLENGSLRDRIMEVAEKVRFKLSEIFVMDGSKRSTHSNAYFTGFGKNRRIVLFDTLINSLSEMELIGVLAHEMGHNKKKHIVKMLSLSLVFSFICFFIWSILIFYPPLYQAFFMSGNNLFPALILFPLLMGPVTFLLAPFFNIFSRKYEYEADAFAASATSDALSLQNALIKLNKENLSNLTPHPVYSFFYYSHPTLDERLDSLDSYKK